MHTEGPNNDSYGYQGVPLDEVPLEAAEAWPGEAETKLCVTIVTKPDIWLTTVGTPLRRVGIAVP